MRINAGLIDKAISEPQQQSILTADLSNPQVVCDLKWRFIHKAREFCPEYKVTPHMKPILEALFNWCVMQPAQLVPHKGLWLWGNIGTGKTTILKAVREFCREVRPRNIEGFEYSFRISHVGDVCRDFMEKSYMGVQTYIDSNRQAFDDLGVEPMPLSYYGTMVNVMEYVLLARYERRDVAFTHVTSNISPKQIGQMYGMRVYDRAKEMFNFVEMAGATFRK